MSEHELTKAKMTYADVEVSETAEAAELSLERIGFCGCGATTKAAVLIVAAGASAAILRSPER